MLPHIMKESSLDSKQEISYSNNNNNNNNNNISKAPIEKINSYLKKDNTRIKTDSSKDEKNISDEKQLTNTLIEIKETNDSINKKDTNNKESIALEENPFFLGKNISLCNYNNNTKIIPKTINNDRMVRSKIYKIQKDLYKKRIKKENENKEETNILNKTSY